jgi:hypothetical protein
MANITKVPNGPLIKKKGPFKGSTLKSGGTVKKAQNGDTLTVKKPTWQRMTQDQRAAKKAELGPEGFKKYKDSISTEATNRRVKATGLSAEQLAKNDQKLQEKMARKKDAVDEGSQKCGPNFKSTQCGISKAAAKESKSDWKKKRNGGPVKKAQTGIYQPMSAKTRIKTRSEDGNYKLKIKGNKVVERRTLKGFFKGAPRAAGRMKEVPAGLIDSLTKKETKKETKESSKDVDKTPVAKKQVAMSKPSSFVAPLGQVPMERKSTDTTPVKTKAVMKKGGKVVKAKAGAMIKRADGSMSRRGLWDNMRANKGSGKKPTAAMLKQEKKIKAKTKK